MRMGADEKHDDEEKENQGPRAVVTLLKPLTVEREEKLELLRSSKSVV